MSIASIAGTSLAALAVLSLATMLLPRHVKVERSALLNASPADVIALAASNEGYQKFNPYRNTEPSLKIEFFGPRAGIGSGFKFSTDDLTGTQTVKSVSEFQVDYALDLGVMGKPTQRIVATPLDSKTQVVWSMNADLGFNPIARVMGLMMDRMQGPTFETGLHNLSSIAQR